MIARVGFFLVFAATVSTAAAQQTVDDGSDGASAVPVAELEKGLAFLATRQTDDGAFATNGNGRNVAVCALAGMTWLSNGSTPDRGPYGEEVARVTDYLIEHTDESGFISGDGAATHGPMYGHGF